MFQWVKHWFRPIGLVILPDSVQWVRLSPGAGLQPRASVTITSLAAFTAGRRFSLPTSFAGCLPVSQVWMGRLHLPAGVLKPSLRAEVKLLIEEVLGSETPKVFDMTSEAVTDGWQVTYVATALSRIADSQAFAARLGIRFASLDVDVFALRRAILAVMPACRKEARVAMLWVGEKAARFALFEDGQVIQHNAWHGQEGGALTMPSWVHACALATHQAGLQTWVVCAATAAAVSAVMIASSELGLLPTLLDLSPFGAGHQPLANAFLAFGLALRGWADD